MTDFDQIIDRRNTHAIKIEGMKPLYGIAPDEGIAMWVADMDFPAHAGIQQALRRALDHGIYGYFGNDTPYRDSICWWMQTRHGWQVEPGHIFTTAGLVNAVGLLLDSFTAPGDGVVLFTPVYHAFARVIRAAGRRVVECPMVVENGRHRLDLAGAEAALSGTEKMLIFCSPHNPGGRVWSRAELEGVAEFARRHDLLLVSDEIHHDLVYPGTTHIPMAQIEGVTDRLVMLTSSSKTFNIAGLHVGNVIIADPDLRARFGARMAGLGIAVNSLGLLMSTAAYSPAGAAWVDELLGYLDGNRQLFDAAMADIPGVRSMPLEATYLAWVDFTGTGMTEAEIAGRLQDRAGIAANHGTSFGSGGAGWMRFNLGMPRARVEEACARLRAAFDDLQ